MGQGSPLQIEHVSFQLHVYGKGMTICGKLWPAMTRIVFLKPTTKSYDYLRPFKNRFIVTNYDQFWLIREGFKKEGQTKAFSQNLSDLP